VEKQQNLSTSTISQPLQSEPELSPVPIMPSMSFRDLSQRLLQSAAKPRDKEVVESGSEESLVFSEEKLINNEEEPRMLANISDMSPQGQHEVQLMGQEVPELLNDEMKSIELCDNLIKNEPVLLSEPLLPSSSEENNSNLRSESLVNAIPPISAFDNIDEVEQIKVPDSSNSAVIIKEVDIAKVIDEYKIDQKIEEKSEMMKQGNKDVAVDIKVESKPESHAVPVPPSGFSFEEVTIFDDLLSKQASTDTRDHSRWRLVSHDKECNFAVYSWLVNSLVLVLHLGEKLKPKKSRKSVGRTVGHWAVNKLYFKSMHRTEGEVGDTEDDVFDAAHFSVTRKFPESHLRSQCPNTYSLSSLLKSISAYVGPAATFLQSLNFVRGRFAPFSVTRNIVKTGFVSIALGEAFDLQVDFSEGFGAAPATFTIVRTIGPVNKEVLAKVVSSVSPGPEYIKEMANMVEQYLLKKEKKLVPRSKVK